jgi:GNAT superfamily N-acetyltransferase
VAWLSTVAEAVAALIAAGLALLWLYALRSIVLSVRAAKKARQALAARPRSSTRVSVVIAARNEAENLAKLLPSIAGVFDEVIVVDDASTDTTPSVLARLAEEVKELRYIRVEEVPRGWAPKSYALYTGAGLATGDILFFLDADTRIHGAAELRRLVEKTHNGEIVGFVPRFLCKTRRCEAIEAAVTAAAYGFYGLHRVMDRRDKLAWMYGCCWAVRRETYWSLGGHKAVAESIVEDRDFATHAKRHGVPVILPDARDLIGVWTYDDVDSFAWLIARLYIDPLRSRRGLGKALAAAAAPTTTYGPLLTALIAALTGSILAKAAFLAPLALQLAAYATGAVIEGYSPLHALTGIVYGQLVYPLGLVRALRGEVYWKARRL